MLAIELEQLVSDTQARERQSRRGPRGNHHMDVAGRVIQQQLQQLHGLRSVHRLQLVQEQRKPLVLAGASVDHTDGIERLVLAAGQ